MAQDLTRLRKALRQLAGGEITAAWAAFAAQVLWSLSLFLFAALALLLVRQCSWWTWLSASGIAAGSLFAVGWTLIAGATCCRLYDRWKSQAALDRVVVAATIIAAGCVGLTFGTIAISSAGGSADLEPDMTIVVVLSATSVCVGLILGLAAIAARETNRGRGWTEVCVDTVSREEATPQ